ncbi:dihydropyrimidinase [Gaiella sp.]|uniref:dihydropyrimidinase n=1 Tax=Gaiella sp. TaxID=2663207 RepID=UPI003983C07F
MTYDLVVRGGTIITSDRSVVADVGVRGETIAAIGDRLRGAREIDATGMYVLPGAIDGHVHMRTNRAQDVYDDTFETGTIAAAFGGVTTMVDQAQVEVGTSLSDGLDSRLAEAEASLIDYSVHINVREASLERVAEIPAIAERGFPSFKFFMNYETYALPDEIIFAAMQAVASCGGLAIVHAEHRGVIEELERQNRLAGRTGPEWHLSARPPELEAEATHRALALAQIAGVRLLIFHMTASEALREVRAARARGQEVYGEVCTQYVLLSDADIYDPVSGTALRFSPPLRTPAHQEALWAALADGTLDVISTDHGPRRRVSGPDGQLYTPPGTSGIETRLSLFHTFGVLAGRMSLQRWVDACCTRPAVVCGLPTKGRVDIGYDADLVVFDPEAKLTLSHEVLHSDIDYSTYDGITVQGLPVTTISRGEVLIEDRTLMAAPGRGRLAPRGYPGPL